MEVRRDKSRSVQFAAMGVCGLLLASWAPAAWAANQSIGEPGRQANGPNPLMNVYFGEQHLHTSASPDAFAVATRGTWDDAYRYAKGEEVKLSTTGKKIQKRTPYDFVAITDHAEYFGVMPRLIDPKDPLSKTDFAKKLADKNAKMTDPTSAVSVILRSILTSIPMSEYVKPELLSSNWKSNVAAANTRAPVRAMAWRWGSTTAEGHDKRGLGDLIGHRKTPQHGRQPVQQTGTTSLLDQGPG